MQKTKVSRTMKITISGIVIAAYVVVMFLTQSFAFGQYQIRIATSIYALASIYPFLIVPLGLANFLSNTLMGGLGLPDMIGGFIVGIITAFSCFHLRKISIYFVALPILIFPTFLVPIWLSYLIHVPYLVLVVNIGLGQILPSIVGVFIVKYLEKPLTKI
ncbi:MAG TPA: QueT transporter family protein [Patescibacteria group bacterium]|nr:QueT transporter family protein [Patescibacteria group bacterium]